MNPHRKFLKLCQNHDLTEFHQHCQRFELPPRRLDCLFLPSSLRQQVARVAELVAHKLSQVVTYEPQVLSDLGLPDWLAEVASQDGPQDLNRAIWRLDLAWHPEQAEVAVLEVNAADPSGLAWSEALAQGLWKSRPMQRLREQQEIEVNWLLPPLLELLPADPVVCVCPHWSFVVGDHRALVQLVRESGREADYWDPDQSWVSKIGTLVRDALDELYLYYPRTWSQILELRSQGVPIVNPLQSQAAEPKGWLARLGDCPGLASTYCVADWPGGVPDERAEWVLKPSFGYGGQGVRLGRLSSAQSWQLEWQRASQNPHAFVLQRHYKLLRWCGLPTTLSAWIIGGRFAGMFARAHRHPVTNVKRGALLLPVFYYRDDAKAELGGPRREGQLEMGGQIADHPSDELAIE